jgi:hypothetical protein
MLLFNEPYSLGKPGLIIDPKCLALGAGGMAQVAEYFPSKYKTLSLNLCPAGPCKRRMNQILCSRENNLKFRVE